jgi:hypothetical protein
MTMKTRTKNLQAVKISIIMGFVIIFMAGIVCAERSEITEEEVVKAQKAWSDAVVNLGKTYTNGQDYKKAAENLVDNLYAYQTGQVLFKPTKAAVIKFRTTKEGAISYFIGHNKNFPEDKGFALEPWTNVQFKNVAIYINGNVAMAMGKYFFTPQKGDAVKVEYTFGYVKNDDGKLKIVLHHSSLPYTNK